MMQKSEGVGNWQRDALLLTSPQYRFQYLQKETRKLLERCQQQILGHPFGEANNKELTIYTH